MSSLVFFSQKKYGTSKCERLCWSQPKEQKRTNLNADSRTLRSNHRIWTRKEKKDTETLSNHWSRSVLPEWEGETSLWSAREWTGDEPLEDRFTHELADVCSNADVEWVEKVRVSVTHAVVDGVFQSGLVPEHSGQLRRKQRNCNKNMWSCVSPSVVKWKNKNTNWGQWQKVRWVQWRGSGIQWLEKRLLHLAMSERQMGTWHKLRHQMRREHEMGKRKVLYRGRRCAWWMTPRVRFRRRSKRGQSTCGCNNQCRTQPMGSDGRDGVCTVHSLCFLLSKHAQTMTTANNNPRIDGNKLTMMWTRRFVRLTSCAVTHLIKRILGIKKGHSD